METKVKTLSTTDRNSTVYPQAPQQRTGKQRQVRKVAAGILGLVMLASVVPSYGMGKAFRGNDQIQEGLAGYKIGCTVAGGGLCPELQPSPRPEYTPQPTPKYNGPYPTPRPNSGSRGGATLAR
jgi:hypothetical protein